ncbi:MAG: hypothetical protein U5L07_11010 [Desulfobacterales bacterium]|nr:hypothetical protein [Desulfobacterales bacterium]
MVKRVTAYRFSKPFKKQYQGLPKDIQQTFNEKLRLFLDDTSHPSLRAKKIQGTKDIWEGSVTMKYRFTFHFEGNTVIFRTISTHDILLRE